MRLRIGVVGQGRDWQGRYLPALRGMRERFQVVGVYNSVHALAENCAREFDAIPYVSYREMMENPSLDAVLVLEDDWYQLMPLLAACDYGKAVFCGAEIDLTSATAAEIKERIRSAGIAFMTELGRRFAPATLRLKELIATRLGPPRLLFCHRRLACENKTSRDVRPLEARSQRELVELIDWCNYIVDSSPTWVQAIRHVSPECTATADYQVFSLGYGEPEQDSKAILAQISCGAYIPEAWHEAINYRPPAAIQVCCEKGVAFVDLPSTLVWFDGAGRHQETLDTEMSIGQQMFSQFHRAVTSLVCNSSDLDDACAALEILDTAKKSMGAKARVSLGTAPK